MRVCMHRGTAAPRHHTQQHSSSAARRLIAPRPPGPLPTHLKLRRQLVTLQFCWISRDRS